MKPIRVLVAMILAGSVSSGCLRHQDYRGDGVFKDHGWQSYSHRYAVDLGPVELSEIGSRTYTLKGLPRAEFSVGVAVSLQPPVNLVGPNSTHTIHVRLQLSSEAGEVIFTQEGPLSSWVAMTASGEVPAFFYQRGEGRDIPLPGGGTKGERLGVGPSGGWGTYFYSERTGVYTLTFSVLESDLPPGVPAQIELSGWQRE